MPLVTGWTPRRFVWKWRPVAQDHTQGGDTEEDAGVYPMTPGNRLSEGGTVNHAMAESYPLKKALPGLAGIGLHNWGVECTAHTGIPSRRGWSGAPSMKRAPDP